MKGVQTLKQVLGFNYLGLAIVIVTDEKKSNIDEHAEN